MGLRQIILVKDEIMKSINRFMEDEGFVQAFYQGISDASGSCEAVANVFILKESSFLTLAQTQQLLMEAELINSDLPRMWTIGRSFRRDVKDDGRHLNDFALMEYEGLDVDLYWLLAFNERLLGTIFQDILRSNLLTREQSHKLYTHWKEWEYSENNGLIPYEGALELLKDNRFDIQWGDDLKREHEAALTKELGIVQVTHYPEEIKFFNMARSRALSLSEGRSTVECVDVLLPNSGETIGGSEREYDYGILRSKLESSTMLAQLKQLKEEHDSHGEEIMDAFEKYLDLFKDREVKRSGGGLGLGRLLQFVLDSPNIIPF